MTQIDKGACDRDKQRREVIEGRNSAEALVHATERTLPEHGAKLSEPHRRGIDDAVNDLRETAKGDDIAAIRAKANTLQQASMKLAEAMQASAQAGPEAGPTQAGGDGVVDADLTEIDKKK